MFTFKYPDCVPAIARTEIDKALVEAEENFAAIRVPADVFDDPGFDRVEYEVRYRAESDRATVPHVVKVCAVVARELYMLARPLEWSADTLSTTADRLLERLLEHTYETKHSKHEWYRSMPGREVTLADFTAAVRRELKRSYWWSELQGVIRHLQAIERAAVATRTERRRQWIKDYCDEHHLTREGFNRAVGLSDTAVRALINDTPNRTGPEAKQKLLRLLGKSPEEWDRL